MAKGRIPTVQLKHNTLLIRKQLRLFKEPLDIARELNIPERTVYNYIERIRKENQLTVESLRTKEGMANDIQLAIEEYEEQARKMHEIQSNAKSDYAKIEATNSIVDITTQILNTKGYIPRLFGDITLKKEDDDTKTADASVPTEQALPALTEARPMGTGGVGEDDGSIETADDPATTGASTEDTL